MPCITPASGHLERRGIGDIDTLTVREYLARSFWGRVALPRLSSPDRHVRHRARLSVHSAAPTAGRAHAPMAGSPGSAPWRPISPSRSSPPALIWFIGIGPFLFVHLPIMLLAASVGVWLFYVQHQFEDTVLGTSTATGHLQGRPCTAARTMTCPGSCAGSPPISASTTSIICAAVSPTTDCHSCCAIIPDLSGIGRLTLVESFRCVRLVLWDEGQQRLVSFREVRQRYALV